MNELVKELQAVTEPLVREIQEIRGRLRELEGRVRPDDSRVQDLEARLAELEDRLRLSQVGVVGRGSTANLDSQFLAVAARAIPEDTPIKRAIDTSLIANAGKLNPEQADAFIDYVVSQQVTLSRIRVRRMRAPQALIEELTVSARRLRAATEGTAPAVADAFSTKKRTLTTVEVIWGEDVTLSFLEDNIEGRAAENHIARLLATQFGNDLADLGWKGNTSLPATITDLNNDGRDDTTGLTQADHTFLRINDGWLRVLETATETKTYNASGATKASVILQNMLRLLPDRYQGLDLAYFVPPELAMAYADELAARATGLGDQAVVQGIPVLRYFGYPVIPDPYLRREGNLPRRAVLTPLDNLVFGVQRDVTIDAMWQPRRRVVEYTVTARVDYEVANPDAAVLATNIPAL